MDTVITRCSLPDPKIVISTNPKGPYHWLKLRFIDESLPDAKRIAWRLADNPYGLPEGYIEELQSSLTGAALRRDVYGEWAGNTGLIFPDFKPTPPPDGEPRFYDLAMDFASSSVSHVVLVGVWDANRAHVVDEWRYTAGRDGVELTTDEQARRIARWLAGRETRRRYIDPAASHMRVALQRVGLQSIPAQNDVEQGIYALQLAFERGRLGVDAQCRATVRELSGYEWDEAAQLQGIDKPVKANDHACDALRYWCYSVQNRPSVRRSSYE